MITATPNPPEASHVTNDNQALARTLLETLPVVFLGSVDADGFPATKAMLQPRHWEGIEAVYFSTNTSSERVAHFRANNKACVYLCEPDKFRAVLLTGTIEVLTDRASKELVWRDGDTRFYPGGIDDPDFCVLRFSAIRGRRYSDMGSESFGVVV